MLTPEQMTEMRELTKFPGEWQMDDRYKVAEYADCLLADRAKIAQELERIKLIVWNDSDGSDIMATRAINALIERIKA